MLPGHTNMRACMHAGAADPFPSFDRLQPTHKKTGRSRTLVTGIRKLALHTSDHIRHHHTRRAPSGAGHAQRGRPQPSKATPSYSCTATEGVPWSRYQDGAGDAQRPETSDEPKAAELRPSSYLGLHTLAPCISSHTAPSQLCPKAILRPWRCSCPVAPTLLSQVNVGQASRHTLPSSHAKVVLLAFQAVPSSDRPGPSDCNCVPQSHSKHTVGSQHSRKMAATAAGHTAAAGSRLSTHMHTHTARLQQSETVQAHCHRSSQQLQSQRHTHTHAPLKRITHPGMLIPKYLNAVWHS